MSTINTDSKYTGLGKFGYTGAQEDRELKFYQANGATSNSLADAELQFLSSKGYTVGTSEDRWKAYLISLGYSGIKDDDMFTWWNDFPSSSLNLNFTNETLDPRVSFSRASNATRVGPTGLIEYAPHNLLTYSEQFDNAAWTGSGGVTANSILSPNGTQTGDTISTLSAGLDKTSASASVISGATLTLSIYIKTGGTVPFVRLQLWDNSANGCRVWVNNATGAVGTPVILGTGTVVSANSVAVNDGWYRISITGTIGTGSSAYFSFAGADADGSFSRTATQTYGIWGAQLNVGALQPYYPTTVKNLLGFTQEFDNSVWAKTNATVTPNSITAPDGTATADTLTGSGFGSIYQTVSVTPNTTCTFSFYAKLGTLAAANFRFAIFNATASSFIAQDIVPSETLNTTEWKRVTYEFVVPSGCTSVRVYPFRDNNGGTGTAYIWGAQLSDSASLDPYVYNPGAAPAAAAYYGPRFDYDPVTLEPKGLLIEEQRTNLLTYSEQFDNAVWTKTNSTVTANATTAPDGNVTADKLVEDTSTAEHTIILNFSVTSGTTYTLSIYVKKAERTYCRFGFTGLGFSSPTRSTFDLESGTVFINTGGSPQIVSVGNGWYRLSVTNTATSSTTSSFIVQTALDGNTILYTGNGTSGIYIWGAQLEAGSFPTSYIPTTSAQVTRSADVATMVGANFSNWYNQSEGTLFAEAVVPANLAAFPTVATISDGSANNQLSHYCHTSGFYTNVRSGGVVQGDPGRLASPVTGSPYKYATALKLDDARSAANGTVGTLDSALLMPVNVNQMQVGANATGGSVSNTHIRRIAYYPRRLADAELQAITS